MTEMSDWVLTYQGKVRDVYIPVGESPDTASTVLMVASNRVSALDVILSPEIPGKGNVLTEVSGWWMDQFPDVPNHLVSGAVPDAVTGRAVIARSLNMLPVECVVRGYLAGSGWAEYRESGTVCGISLPPGLQEGDKLPEPLFTPATKAAVGDHDINIDFDDVVSIVGAESAHALRDTSVAIYSTAQAIAESKGLVLADTKFEFGVDKSTGELVWADEALTPDSSRYWDLDTYLAGGLGKMASFDKQPIRDWLRAHWSGEGEPPALPPEVVRDTQQRYANLRDRLVGSAR
jgi:phosphoribosylaminoimidazole-succinocarboxamide synthase